MYELGTLRHTQRMCTTIISSALRFAIKVRSAMFRALHHPVGRGPQRTTLVHIVARAINAYASRRVDAYQRVRVWLCR